MNNKLVNFHTLSFIIVINVIKNLKAQFYLF